MKMSEPRRMHPIAALLSGLRALREMLLPLAILFISSVFRGDMNEGKDLLWRFGSAGVIVVGTLLWGILVWSRYRYSVEEGELRVEHGVLVKKRNFIAKQRIQTVDFTEPLLHRLFGVVKVTVETAGGEKPEAMLTAVTREEAERLKQELMFNRNAKADVVSEEETKTDTKVRAEVEPDFIYQLPVKQLVIYGATSGGLGVVLSLFAAGFSQISDVLPYERIFAFFNHFVISALLILAFLVLLVAWFLGVAGVMLKYGGFTLMKTGDKLLITRGWLERRQLTVSINRVQAVRITEGLLRQPFGLVTVQVDTAGYGAAKGETTVLFPLLRRNEAIRMIERVLPGFCVQADLQPLPRRAAGYYMLRWVMITLVACLAIFLWTTDPWRYGIFLLILPAVLFGWLQYRAGGFAIHGHKTLVLRSRRIARTTSFIPRRRIQFAYLRRMPWQRLARLTSYAAVIVSGKSGAKLAVHHIEETDGQHLYDWIRTDRKREE